MLVSALSIVDYWATGETRGSYKASAPAGTPIDSAVLQNAITPASVQAQNLIVVIVEALGEPVEPVDRAIFARTWGAQRWSARYAVTTGKSLYFGSTTNAELREWCGVWADQYSFDFDSARCLPADFAKAGFTTTAMHSFTGDFFDRETWYPQIGFQRSLFAPELHRAGAGDCGGVFPGACDRDVPAIIGRMLRENPAQRQVIYWLTLNSHLPVPADEGLRTTDCRIGPADWNKKFPMLCRNYQLQQILADAIHAEVMNPSFPEADILIVGDHMPPFFPRATRTRYDSAVVPWIYLRHRAAMTRNRPPAIATPGTPH